MGLQEDMSNVKKESLLAGKLQVIQIFAEVGKLGNTEIERTVKFITAIIEKHSKILQKLAQERKDAQSSDDNLQIDPKNEQFLKGIDLGDTSEEEKEEDQVHEDSDDKWSKPYLALLCLENLFQKCEPSLVISMIRLEKQLCSDIVELAWRHQNYWVRLTAQRFFGHVFSYLHKISSEGKAKSSLSDVMSIDFKEDDALLKLIYQMLSVLNFPHVTEELSNQLIKNLVFLQRLFIHACKNQNQSNNIIKPYKKASYIGRKFMVSFNYVL